MLFCFVEEEQQSRIRGGPLGIFHCQRCKAIRSEIPVVPKKRQHPLRLCRRGCPVQGAETNYSTACFLALTSSIMGRRSSSRIPGISSISSDGCTSSTTSRAKPQLSSPMRICVRVWCCLITSQPRKRVTR